MRSPKESGFSCASLPARVRVSKDQIIFRMKQSIGARVAGVGGSIIPGFHQLFMATTPSQKPGARERRSVILCAGAARALVPEIRALVQ